MMPVAVVVPGIVWMVSPPGVAPLRRALCRVRLLALLHTSRRDHATERFPSLRRGLDCGRRSFFHTDRAAPRTVCSAMKHRLVHLLRVPAAVLAGGIHDSRLDALAHISP